MLGTSEQNGGASPGGGAAGESPASPAWRPLTAGVAGFVAGAVAWHFVGFWSFVSSVVLRGPETAAPPAAASPAHRELPRASFRAIGTRHLPVDPAHCSSIGLDRGTGMVTAGACTEPGATFAFKASGRKDRAATAAREAVRQSWIVEVNAAPDP